MEQSAVKLIKRIQKAKERKLKREGELKEAYRYVLPTRDTMNEKKGNAMERGVKFDSTASNAIEKYATKLQNLLTPAWEEWLKFQPGSDIPDEEKDNIQGKLDKVSDVAFAHIHHSNFYTAEHEAFLDLGISTGGIIVEQNTRKNESSVINCRSIPLAEIIPEISSRGSIDTVWREFKVRVNEIKGIWAEADIPPELLEKAQHDEDVETKVYEGVVYNEETSLYTMYVIEDMYKKIMHEEEMESSPFIIFRESVRPGDVLGFGRALRILEDIKTLNKLAENALRADGINSMPIFTAVDSGSFNPYNVVLQPGSIIPVSSNDTANPSLRPLDVSNGYQLSENRMEQLRAIINETFLANPYGSIEQTPVRSATEIAAREADLFQSTAAAFGRLQTEFLEPFMKRVMFILKDNGKIPDIKVDGKMVTIKFTSPFAKMQGSEKVKNTMQWLGYVSTLGPDILKATTNFEAVPHHLATNMGIDKELYKGVQETKDYIQKVGEGMAAQQAAGGELPQGIPGGEPEQQPMI